MNTTQLRLRTRTHDERPPFPNLEVERKTAAIHRLQGLNQILRSKIDTGPRSFKVPQFLVESGGANNLVDVGSPYAFLQSKVGRIIEKAELSSPRIFTTRRGVLYLAFMRSFASLDGRIGTALTQISFLEFLCRTLNVDTFISLPVSMMGHSNQKGLRGSPFSVSDPFSVDPSIADPLLPELDPISQYRILIDACTALDMRAGSIIPLTTLAMESNLFLGDPALGYWWQRKPGELLYAGSNHENEMYKAAGGKFAEPFCAPPLPEETMWLQTPSGPRLSATSGSVTLVNALPDPIAGDPATYTWQDVAAVRFTDDFVPPSQGTLRNVVWDYNLPAFRLMPEVVRWRAETLGERVFIVDVCASLPKEILRRTRIPEIEFIAEQLWDFDARGDELDGVVGPLIFGVGANWTNPDLMSQSLLSCLHEIQWTPPEKFFLAGASNHDTRPVPPKVTAAIWAATWLLPQAVPFIFSGSEHGSELITNKEFGFSDCEQRSLDEGRLALFNDCPVEWDELPDTRELHSLSGKLIKLRTLTREVLGPYPKLQVFPCATHLIHYQLQSTVRSSAHINVFFNCGHAPQAVQVPEADLPVLTVGDVEVGREGLREFLLSRHSTVILANEDCGLNPALLA